MNMSRRPHGYPVREVAQSRCVLCGLQFSAMPRVGEGHERCGYCRSAHREVSMEALEEGIRNNPYSGQGE